MRLPQTLGGHGVLGIPNREKKEDDSDDEVVEETDHPRQPTGLHAHRADDRGGHHRDPGGHRRAAVSEHPFPLADREGPGRYAVGRLGTGPVLGPLPRSSPGPRRYLSPRAAPEPDHEPDRSGDQ